ncbi:MAG: metallophosphoesterase [Deltaproteobacteria bacterium]|nr:metallophosphoesterase [Deltaproteobacteria bacterium]
MLIGVCSDIHDNIPNLNKMISIFKSNNVEILVFCGDFCSPIPLSILGRYNGVVHCVFGNNDADRFSMLNTANTSSKNVKLHGEYAELELDKIKTAVTHYPFYAKALAKTGDFKTVFYGHTHEYHKEFMGDCLLLNPGEVMGYFGGASCAIYDTNTHDAERIEL